MATEKQPAAPPATDRDTAYIILTVGAVAGAALLLWPVFPFTWWWDPLIGWLREGSRDNLWRPGVVVFSGLAGLAVTFGCFQYVRPIVRVDPTARLVLYGYNTGLTAVLLLLLLVIVNVSVNLFFPRFLDTTQGSFHSVSEVTKRYVAELDQPAKVYMVMSPGDPAYSNMYALLTMLHDANPTKFEFEHISPSLNDVRLNDLVQHFPKLKRQGLVVTLGDEKNYSLISQNELTTDDINMETGRSEGRLFNGEVRLLQELAFLAEGKRYVIVATADGAITSVRRELLVKDVPKAISDAVAKEQPHADWKSIESVAKLVDGKETVTHYEFSGMAANRGLLALRVKPDGTGIENRDKKAGDRKRADRLPDAIETAVKRRYPKAAILDSATDTDDGKPVYWVTVKEDKSIYVTQGNGEPVLDEPSGRGISELARRLREAKYHVLPLVLKPMADGKKPTVPDDADMVIVAGPTRPMPFAVEALQEYLEPTTPGGKKGKLIVFLGPTPAAEGAGNKMRQTGLEDMLRKFNVEVTNDKLLTFAGPDNVIRMSESPERVVVATAYDAVKDQHPLAMNFAEQSLRWSSVREVRPATTRADLRATAVMLALGTLWKETDMNQRVFDKFQQFQKNPNAYVRSGALIQEPISVMVTVSELTTSPMGRGETPRLVVFGTGSMPSDDFLTDRYYDLIKGAVDWNRERFSSIGVQPKTHKNYTLPGNMSLAKLFVLPAIGMIAGILGLGAIVWTMRRR